ncbi:MAG TPA: YfiR family protein [Opitutaceae bacterium]|nr:YfiR family protein [Opitutaceae bacterium]
MNDRATTLAKNCGAIPGDRYGNATLGGCLFIGANPDQCRSPSVDPRSQRHARLKITFRTSTLFALFPLLLNGGRAAAEQSRRAFLPDEVKAVFVINFCHFTTWPPAAFSSANSPIQIGVLGNSPFTELLRVAAQNESVGNRRIEVRRVDSWNELENIQLLFVPENAERRFEQWPQETATKTLTVGEARDFLRDGGHLQLIQDAGRIRIAANLDALKQTELQLSSNLLRIADVAARP